MRRLLFLAPLATAALLLAGCAGTAGGSPSDDGRLSIVTSTNVYGQIAQEIGGDAVRVTPLIESGSQDPHAFEASASDQLTVRGADLLVENGGGYDSFFDTLVTASGSTAPVIVAAEYSPAWPDGPRDAGDTATTLDADHHAEEGHDHDHIEGFNEHVWYDPHTAGAVAEAIAAELAVLDPGHADLFAANAAAFSAQIAGLEDALSAVKAQHAGAPVFATEPVPGYMTAAAGLETVTPVAFSEAVEEGNDVPPATLLEALGLLQSGAVKLVIVNAQTGGAETSRVVDAAKTSGIPVLEFTETLPDGQTYVGWMTQNVDEIAQALGR